LAEASWTEPAGTVVGTARYAAPEQAGGKPLDGRADLYSLAVVLVESCTGTVPGVADTAIGTMAVRSKRGIESPAALGPLVPVIERAGRPEPHDRYPDAAAMGAALTAAARTLPSPGALPIAGIGEMLDDVDSTRHRPLGRAFDQDAATGEVDVADDAAPLAIPVPRRPQFRRSTVPWVVGIVVTAVLAASIAMLAAGAASGGPQVVAPSLVGLDSATAKVTATDAELLMTVVARRTSDDPAGLVIEQRPGPGEFIGSGEEIQVVVSRGPPPVLLPDVTGKPLAEAQPLLEQAGFVVAVERRFDENVPKDITLGTEPAGGGQAPPESTVKLIVSDGPAPVEVPNVAGKSYDAAAAAISAKRLTPVKREEFSDSIAVGTVIGTDPGSGDLAPRDSEVGVIVSKGPELIAVPNLVGQTVEAASSALKAAGLVANVQNFSSGAKVRAQDPSAGTLVQRGAKVTLFL
jgi:serine/threonine-protein kinase